MKRRTFLQLFGLSLVPGIATAGRIAGPVEMPRMERPLERNNYFAFVSCGYPMMLNVTSGTMIGSWIDFNVAGRDDGPLTAAEQVTDQGTD